MKRKIILMTAFLAFMLLLAPALLKAQTTGTLRGIVVDDNGDAMPGVTIEITSDALMQARSSITDQSGIFRFLYLPPGSYIVCAKLEGFDTCWLRGIPVQVQQTTNAEVVLNQGSLEESIEVTAAAPLIDMESSSKTYNVNLEMLNTVPLSPRLNFEDIYQTLPGVSGGWGQSPLVNAGGITHNLEPGKSYFWDHHNQDDSYENKVKIDGMEINDSMSGTSYAEFNYEAVQEIDVKTAGAGAEYGNARSSFMNVVTKSGGNELQGSFLLLYQPESFNWTNVEGGTASANSYAIPAVTLSGPILQDKLWFLASYKYDNENYQFPDTIVVEKLVREHRGHMPYLKLTFQAHPSHTISAVYQNDYVEGKNASFPSTTYSTLDAAQRYQRGGPMFSGTWRWIVSDDIYFNAVVGYNKKPRETYAQTESPRYQYTERNQGGSTLLYDKGYGEDYYSIRENLLFSGDLTYFVDQLGNTGSHEFKIGAEVRPYQHVTRTRKYWGDQYGFFQYRLGLDYANYGLSEPYFYRGYMRRGAPGTPNDRYDNEVTVSNQNFYVQDAWVINQNLTITLGMRYEHQREYMHFRDELPPENDAIYADMRNNVEFDDAGLAPRLGLTYNLENIGVFKFHYGRYFEYVGTGDYNNYARNITSDQYRMPTALIPTQGTNPAAMTLYSAGTLGYNPDYNRDMKMEYNDEFLVSFEKEIFANLAFETTFIYRSIHMSNMEDVNAVFSNGAFVDRRFPGYDTIWERTWYDEPRWKFDYSGLQFNVKRNFVGSWGFMANYSLMWRNYRKLEWDPGDPNQFVYSSPSDLDMDHYGRRWALHISAFYRLPYDILLSTFINGNDGVFVADTNGDYAWDQSAPQVTLSNGRRVGDIVWIANNDYYAGKQWGSQGRRTDSLWIVNLRLAKGVTIKQFRFEAALDLYNAFNWVNYSSFESNDIRRDFTDSAGINHYTRQTSPQPPRSAQLSFKIQF